jgi:hypothetical protein
MAASEETSTAPPEESVNEQSGPELPTCSTPPTVNLLPLPEIDAELLAAVVFQPKYNVPSVVSLPPVSSVSELLLTYWPMYATLLLNSVPLWRTQGVVIVREVADVEVVGAEVVTVPSL